MSFYRRRIPPCGPAVGPQSYFGSFVFFVAIIGTLGYED